MQQLPPSPQGGSRDTPPQPPPPPPHTHTFTQRRLMPELGGEVL